MSEYVTRITVVFCGGKCGTTTVFLFAIAQQSRDEHIEQRPENEKDIAPAA